MTATPLWVHEIQTRSAGKAVLLVEGKDDVPLLSYFLTKHSPGWDSKLVILPADGKKRVISGIRTHRPDWVGVVDTDEWNPDDLQNVAASLPRLLVLPRFCIESYFCDPEEVWEALPPAQRNHLGGDPNVLSQPILEVLTDWVAHGAMWRVLRRLHHTAQLPAKLDHAPVTDELEIRTILKTWHEKLAPDLVIQQYHDELAEATTLGMKHQITEYIHGKKFYRQVVVPTLNRLFSSKSAGDWLQRFQDGEIQPPEDLQRLFDEILALPVQA